MLGRRPVNRLVCPHPGVLPEATPVE
jgi:hypothetical protein